MDNKKQGYALAILLLLMVVALCHTIGGEPTGATITYWSNETKNASSPALRNDSKGTITTLVLDSTQQNFAWKAYVGNITSTFTLDDEADYTIYQWTPDSFSGQVYISRSDSVAWATIDCVNSTSATAKTNEDTALGHSSTAADSINRTFDDQIHPTFTVSGESIPENCSYSTATWVSDAAQTFDLSASFIEVLLTDGTNLVYTTFVEDDATGYKGDGTTYDFQAIVAEDSTITNTDVGYYFYVELTS